MNNYSSPRIIRVLNKLDTSVGSLAILFLAFIVVLDPDIAYDYADRFFIVLLTIVTLYAVIGLLKICSYTYCIFQGYRVTIIGMVLYIVWILAISIAVAVVWIYFLLGMIETIFV